MQWFNVDKAGLAKLLERKGKQFVLNELLSNAWDESTTKVEVSLVRLPGTRYVQLQVTDDNPNGFADLSHAFTLFAESAKKGQEEKRGRFNLGEKLVLALCEEAQIVSTRGGISFGGEGRKTLRTKTERGSVFTGRLRMTNEELQACHDSVHLLLPPPGVETLFNGVRLASRKAVTSFTTPLVTEVADVDGALRNATRTATVQVFEPLPGETPMLYELGIPVVETGDRWHVNVTIKVPLTFERDNVPPSYLSKIRALTLQHTSDLLSAEDSNAPWVREAIQKHGQELRPEVVAAVTTLRFGDKAVSYDPSDPESNNLAVAKGYVVVHGGQMSGKEWAAVRAAGALKPAGQVTPSPKPYSVDGDPFRIVPESEWTQDMQGVVRYIRRIAPHLVDQELAGLRIANDPQWPFAATYGPTSGLTLNLGRLGHKWFAGPLLAINDLMIHELGHHACSNHLSEDYYKALTRLGAKLVDLAIAQPEVFSREVELQAA